MPRFKSFRSVACVALCLLGVGLVLPASSVAQQISPNPNPVGNTISITGTTTYNALNAFTNYGGISINVGQTIPNTLTNNFGATIDNYGTVGSPLSYGVARVDNNGVLNNFATFFANLNNAGSFNNNAPLTTFNYIAGSWNNTGTIENNGRMGARDATNALGGTLNNNAVYSGALDNVGMFNNSGVFNDSDGTVNRATGVINNNVGANLNVGIVGNSGVINNYGAIHIGDAPGGLSNFGTLNNSGTLINAGRITNSGSFVVLTGGSVTGGSFAPYVQTAGNTIVDGTMTQSAVNINGGMLQGVGTITAPVTINGGTIAPGDSPGTLTINGSLTFTSGTLLTEIGASASDLLHITGAASFLTGTFSFSFLDGFHLPSGEWIFLTADGGVTGWESLNLEVSGLDSNYSYFITSDGNNLKFDVTAVPEPETYAMLLAGLGLLGFIRRRKLQAA